jgi:hypothetical protein
MREEMKETLIMRRIIEARAEVYKHVWSLP